LIDVKGVEQQIPFGNDRKKSKGKGKDKGEGRPAHRDDAAMNGAQFRFELAAQLA